MILGIVANLQKSNADDAVRKLLAKLDSLSLKYYLEISLAEAMELDSPALDEDTLMLNCDIIVAVGGDGTIIHTAKKAAMYNKAVLGVNAGRLGYMACLETGELDLLENLKNGKYTIEKRMMLEATLSRDENKKYYCLNEVDVSKTNRSRILDISVYNGEADFMSFRADGVIVSSPTGSTAYAMSAGGPVTDPSLSCMILVPVCSMSMYSRGFVLSDDTDIKVKIVQGNGTEAVARFDGDEGVLLGEDEVVRIRKATDLCTQLVKIKGDSFYDILRHKISDL